MDEERVKRPGAIPPDGSASIKPMLEPEDDWMKDNPARPGAAPPDNTEPYDPKEAKEKASRGGNNAGGVSARVSAKLDITNKLLMTLVGLTEIIAAAVTHEAIDISELEKRNITDLSNEKSLNQLSEEQKKGTAEEPRKTDSKEHKFDTNATIKSILAKAFETLLIPFLIGFGAELNKTLGLLKQLEPYWDDFTKALGVVIDTLGDFGTHLGSSIYDLMHGYDDEKHEKELEKETNNAMKLNVLNSDGTLNQKAIETRRVLYSKNGTGLSESPQDRINNDVKAARSKWMATHPGQIAPAISIVGSSAKPMVLPAAKAPLLTKEGSSKSRISAQTTGNASKELLNAIASGESGAMGYDAYYAKSVIKPPKPVSQMTLGEIKEWQKKSVAAGSVSSAVGRYQYVERTLEKVQHELNIPDTVVFSPEIQDKFATQSLNDRGLKDYQDGKISASEFQNNIAQEWASITGTSGTGMYESNINHATKDGAAIVALAKAPVVIPSQTLASTNAGSTLTHLAKTSSGSGVTVAGGNVSVVKGGTTVNQSTVSLNNNSATAPITLANHVYGHAA